MKLVYICSPYRGDVERNIAKAKGYCRFAYTQDATPIAVHLHNTLFLDDGVREERLAGILLGLNMLKRCDELWAFGNRFSEGMKVEIEAAKHLGIPIHYYNDRCEKLEGGDQNFARTMERAVDALTPNGLNVKSNFLKYATVNGKDRVVKGRKLW